VIALNVLAAGVQIASPAPAPITVGGSGIFTSSLLLSILVWTPVLVAGVIAVLPNPRGRYDSLLKQIAFFTNLGLLFVLWVAYNQFLNYQPTLQYEENLQWLPGIGATYHLGVDGPGMVMLVLSGVVGIASVLASFGIQQRVRSYFCLLLLAEACVNGAIVAHDMFVLLLFWGGATNPRHPRAAHRHHGAVRGVGRHLVRHGRAPQGHSEPARAGRGWRDGDRRCRDATAAVPISRLGA